MANEFDIDRIAKLSQLTLTVEEKNKLGKQLSSVINYFEELKQVDVGDTDPTSQTTGLTDILRPDEINPENILSAEEAISGKDDSKINNNYFVVPMLINKK